MNVSLRTNILVAGFIYNQILILFVEFRSTIFGKLDKFLLITRKTAQTNQFTDSFESKYSIKISTTKFFSLYAIQWANPLLRLCAMSYESILSH